MTNHPHAFFQGGTIVLNGIEQSEAVPPFFRWINGKWRCEGVHYRLAEGWLHRNLVENRVPRWVDVALKLKDGRSPHDYQLESLDAWAKAARWGSIVLPTGAGKTFVALRAIAETQTTTLVVVPTIDLLHQWYARLETAFQTKIGVWYGLEKDLQPITVTTYPSAWGSAETLGNQFKLLIFDEIHHLPAPSWHEIALICAAPYRLGLTATYPDAATEGEKRVQLLNDYVGPVVYQKRIDELTGQQLAEYRTERIRVDLTDEERDAYDNAYGIYTGYVREARLRESHGQYWWNEFTRRSGYEQAARRAKVAELKLKDIVHQARGKLDTLNDLLRQHTDTPMLIFTAHNRFAYEISRRHLVPAITHQTKAAERKAILEGFRAGTYRAIVTSKVLNEGVDVPEAKIAVVLGGSATAREYVQRLGRVLRKQGNAEAILYEVIARKTVDESIAQRRRSRVKYHIKKG
ncbi:MAG: DEAD/DEAH box helicase [Chloroflexota bacterium]